MFEEPEYVTSQTDDIVISACPTLVEENRRAQEFLWGYYLRIENNSAKKFSCWAKTGMLPTVSATVFVMIPPDLKASFQNWNPANVLSSVQ